MNLPRQRALALAAVLVLALGAAGGAACSKGPKVPDFKLAALEGGDCSLAQEKGKVVVLTFWHYRCPYCRKQMNEFKKLAKSVDFGKVAIVAVHTHGGVRISERLRNFEGNPNIQICLDDGTVAKKYKKLAKKYRIQGVPHNLILDGKRHIRKVRRGLTKASKLKDDIEDLL